MDSARLPISTTQRGLGSGTRPTYTQRIKGAPRIKGGAGTAIDGEKIALERLGVATQKTSDPETTKMDRFPSFRVSGESVRKRNYESRALLRRDVFHKGEEIKGPFCGVRGRYEHEAVHGGRLWEGTREGLEGRA